MKPTKYNAEYLLLKGYKKSQCFLLRLGGMYIKKDKYEWINYVYVAIYWGTFGMFMFFLIPYSVVTAFPKGEMFIIFQDLHYWVVIFGYTGTSVMYHINRKSIDRVLVMIGKGFYTYVGEENNEEANLIVKKNNDFLKKLTTFMVQNVIGALILVILVPTFLELYKNGGEIPEGSVLNPYLPLPVYTPWNQFSTTGFLSIYILMFLASTFVLSELLALSIGYSSFMVLYVTQFALLNNSIINMEQRATKYYLRICKKKKYTVNKFKDPLFQKCMLFCIKQNIQHHQILISWMKDAKQFLGWALLCTFLATSILLATTGYLFTMTTDNILSLVILIEVQVLELVHSYLFCWWGENLATESGKIPTSLYNIPWYYCDNKFNKTLHIMISNTLTPMVPRDAVLKLKASLEMYGSMISSAYTYFNVIRSTN